MGAWSVLGIAFNGFPTLFPNVFLGFWLVYLVPLGFSKRQPLDLQKAGSKGKNQKLPVLVLLQVFWCFPGFADGFLEAFRCSFLWFSMFFLVILKAFD